MIHGALPARWFLVWPKIYDSFYDIIIIRCSIHLDFQLVLYTYSAHTRGHSGIRSAHWNSRDKFRPEIYEISIANSILTEYSLMMILFERSRRELARKFKYDDALKLYKKSCVLWNDCQSNTDTQRNLLLLDIAWNSFVRLFDRNGEFPEKLA